MISFKEYLFNEQPAPPLPGGLGAPAALPPTPGGLPGGLPPGGPGLPTPPLPPLGGGPPLGGPPMGGAPGGMPGTQQQVMKLDSPDVWKILEKLLGGEEK